MPLRLVLFVIASLCLALAASAQAQVPDEAANERGKAAFIAGDYATALTIWQDMADRNDPLGLNNLAMLYDHGKGVPRSKDKAFELFKRAADHPAMNKPQAAYNVGKYYSNVYSKVRDYQLGVIYWEKAAAMNFGPAEYELGMRLLLPGTEQDKVQALRWFRRAAIHDSVEAAYWAGWMLIGGEVGEPSLEEGKTYLQVAHDGGSADAAYLLGLLADWEYRHEGAPKSLPKGYYETASAGGVKNADVKLWELEYVSRDKNISEGYWLKKNGKLTEAHAAYSRDCEAGHRNACFQQTVMEAYGQGVPAQRLGSLPKLEAFCDGSPSLGCMDFANTVGNLNGMANVAQSRKAMDIFRADCDANPAASASCYHAAFLAYVDRFGLNDDGLARTYSKISCQRASTGNEACQMVRHYQIEDNWKRQASQQRAPRKPSGPSFMEGLLIGLASAANAPDYTSAADRYGQASRQREAARSAYATSAMRPGSANYGACPTVNSPGC